ncbi:elongation factor Ts, mitochondrial [Iris pallida]|uniref:FRIGIDA-like protein n=1 Tax=Iris pallida TaxID=29817 RepID=A0AAX6E836_IRIPA|nr:elongation factor Ts, mitochondrial [Iris pallida]
MKKESQNQPTLLPPLYRDCKLGFSKALLHWSARGSLSDEDGTPIRARRTIAAVEHVDQSAFESMPRRRRRSRFQNQIGLLNLIVSRRKEADVLRSSIPVSLSDCVDPANFVLDAICDVFPVDKLKVKSPSDLTSACVYMYTPV